MSFLPYIMGIALIAGIAQTVRILVQAISAGVVPESIWGGADNSEDHFGFVLRVAFLVILIGVAIYMMTVVYQMAAEWDAI